MTRHQQHQHPQQDPTRHRTRPGAPLPPGREPAARQGHFIVARLAPALLAGLGIAGCNPGAPSVQQHDIAASIIDVSPGPYHAGDTVTYHASLANLGPGRSGGVHITAGYVAGSCVATGGASCPGATDPTAIADMPAGSSLTLTMTKQLSADGLGPQEIDFGIAADGMDTNPQNDVAASALTLVDTRSGTYHLYAADARAYDLQVDFANALWILDGNGPEIAGTITSTTEGGQIVYLLGTSGRFRPAIDGLVGAYDFGQGTMPFIAARTFATATSDVTTTDFAVPGRRWFGSYSSTFDTASLSGDTLSVCSTFVPTTVTTCPLGALVAYHLTASGSDFTGVGTLDPNRVVHLRFANFGGQWALLEADEDATTARQFRVGLADVAPVAGPYTGSTTSGDHDTLALSDSGWTLSRVRPDGTVVPDLAQFVSGGANEPPGLRIGVQSSDSGNYFLVAPGPIGMLVTGGPSSNDGFVMTMLQ